MGYFLRLLSVSILGLFCAGVWSNVSPALLAHPGYIGGLVGHGSTTWGGLVPSPDNSNLAIAMSAPIAVTEGGVIWGGVVGYELSPYFALEATYMRYPQANIEFDKFSIFSFKNRGRTQFKTKTELYGILGKFMVLIPDTNLRLYSSVGGADVHREDMLVSNWRVTPTFGFGLNYHFNERFMGELGGTYTSGYGEALLNPVDTYWPFLYSGNLKLMYCFG